MAAGERTTQIFTLLVSVMVIAYGGMAVIQGQISVGTLIGINAVAAYLLFPISNVVQQALRSQQALAAIERTEEWMALPCEERLGETSSLPRSLARLLQNFCNPFEILRSSYPYGYLINE